jgi:predicted DNA-binding WGR domain protein
MTIKGHQGVRHFVRVRPEKNEHRWYTVAWGPTLFGEWGVCLSWGRLGTNQYQQRILTFASPKEAQAEVERQVARRLKRGYENRTK